MLFHNLFLWHQDIHFALLSSDKSNKCYCGLTLSTQPLVSSFNWWKLVFSFMMPHLYVCHCMSTYISPYHAWINAIPFLLGSLLTQFNVFRVLLPIWFSEHMTDHIIPSLILCILFWVPDTARLCHLQTGLSFVINVSITVPLIPTVTDLIILPSHQTHL